MAAKIVGRIRHRWRGWKDARLIANSGLFDCDWYLRQNPDVKAADVDPLAHYCRHGALEGRDPSPLFETAWYVQQNPEVRIGIDNPLAHYLERTRLPRPTAFDRPPSSLGPIAQRLQPRVLIIAFLDIPQCVKYRVWQKKAHLEALGCICNVIEWKQHEAAQIALQHHTIVIFYRVPAYPPQLALIAAAQQLGLPTFWEVDDLIFDTEAYRANANFHQLDPDVQTSIMTHIPKYRAALAVCKRGIASSRVLAEAMRQAGADSVHVIENGLDAETLALAQEIREKRTVAAHRKSVTLFYGSGSNAHHADFECAADALCELMRNRPEIHLLIVGELLLPPEFDELNDRIERFPYVEYPEYLRLLGQSDVNLAPVCASRFNDAKSNIKYIEASVVGLPSICSPRDTFKGIIDHGVDGLLAETDTEWRQALAALIDDPVLCARMGHAALDNVRRRYSQDVITRTQLIPFVEAACNQYRLS